MKIHITGGAASGKTTLARALSAEMGLPLVHLDQGGFDRQIGQVFVAQREQLLKDCASVPSWISEGTFVGWARPFFEAADVIVLLDVPAWIAYKRIVVRHAKASARRENPYKGLRRLVRFLQATRAWYGSKRTRDEVYGVEAGTTGITHLADLNLILQSYGSKVAACRTQRDVDHVRAALAAEVSRDAAG